jgi:hypothetical protein
MTFFVTLSTVAGKVIHWVCLASYFANVRGGPHNEGPVMKERFFFSSASISVRHPTCLCEYFWFSISPLGGWLLLTE